MPDGKIFLFETFYNTLFSEIETDTFRGVEWQKKTEQKNRGKSFGRWQLLFMLLNSYQLVFPIQFFAYHLSKGAATNCTGFWRTDMVQNLYNVLDFLKISKHYRGFLKFDTWFVLGFIKSLKSLMVLDFWWWTTEIWHFWVGGFSEKNVQELVPKKRRV